MQHLVDVPWLVYALTAVGIAVMFLLPKVTTAVPAPLVVVLVLTVAVVAFGWDVPDVGIKARCRIHCRCPGCRMCR